MNLEIHFLISLISGVIGLIAAFILGFNPWKLLLQLGIVILFIPVAQILLNLDLKLLDVNVFVANYIERIIVELPSIIVGNLGGILAAILLNVIAKFMSRT